MSEEKKKTKVYRIPTTKDRVSPEPGVDTAGKYSFQFNDEGKITGITEHITRTGRNSIKTTKQINPTDPRFDEIIDSSQALDAYNLNKHGSSKFFYETDVQTGDELELEIAAEKERKKIENQNIEEQNRKDLKLAADEGVEVDYTGSSVLDRRRKPTSEVFAYPADIDRRQDHLKISRFTYKRDGQVVAGRPAYVERHTGKFVVGQKTKTNRRGYTTVTNPGETKNVYRDQQRLADEVDADGDKIYGDSLVNNGIPQGSVILPMPKITDTNGAEWGESKMNVFELGAMAAGKGLGKLGLSQEERDAFEIGNKKRKKKGDRTVTGKDIAAVIGTSAFANTVSNAIGQNIGANEFLARTSGRVLNPNAELLFQGPVLRDFNFDFLMIARNKKEGEIIRKIIRFFKIGMAPRFNNTIFLKTPDLFTLKYMRKTDGGDKTLDTVNRFSQAGLALKTCQVDYAPNGYWSAYHDSQPVAVRMSLNFAELRPVFEGDQLDTPEGSVGY